MTTPARTPRVRQPVQHHEKVTSRTRRDLAIDRAEYVHGYDSLMIQGFDTSIICGVVPALT